jgi:hypothetical protein
MSGKQHEDIYNQMSAEQKRQIHLEFQKATSGMQSISSASGVQRKPFDLHINDDKDVMDAKIELSYINAAITLANGSNDIGSEIVIGPFTIGISLNSRLIPLLKAEAEEIEKYLNDELNNYE